MHDAEEEKDDSNEEENKDSLLDDEEEKELGDEDEVEEEEEEDNVAGGVDEERSDANDQGPVTEATVEGRREEVRAEETKGDTPEQPSFADTEVVEDSLRQRKSQHDNKRL